MNQALPVQIDIAQVLPGQSPAASVKSNNININQSDTDCRPSFQQVIAGQLNNNTQAAEVTTDTAAAVQHGNILPGDGKYFPLSGLHPLAQLQASENLSVVVSSQLQASLKAGQDGDSLTEQATVLTLPVAAVAVTDAGNALNQSGPPMQAVDISAYFSNSSGSTGGSTALPAGQSPNSHSSASQAPIMITDDSGTLKPFPTVLTDPQRSNAVLLTNEADSQTTANLINLDKSLHADASIALSRTIRQFLNFQSMSGSPKQDNNSITRLRSLTASPPMDSQNSDSVDSYTFGLQHTGLGADSRAVPSFQINQPVSSPQWHNEFSDRVRWLISGNIKKAEISLVPKNMGAIDISISMHHDQTNININTHNLQSREAIEGSLTRLREMFDQAGLGNVNVDVSQHSDSNAQSSQTYTQDNPRTSPEEPVLTSSIREQQRGHSRIAGAIDLYA